MDKFFDLENDFSDELLPLEEIKKMPVMHDYKEVYELTRGADGLFDFSESKLSPIQQLYIVGYATRGTKKGGCEIAGVSYGVVDKWLKDKEFEEALNSAVGIVRDALEEELIKRAMEGSDSLLLAAVKAASPDKYNKKQAEVKGNVNVVHSWADLAKQAAQVVIEGEIVDD